MTHDRDGWPDGTDVPYRLINGRYRLPLDPAVADDRLREAAYWFREMVRSGGPDSSDLDAAVSDDLDSALGSWEPLPMIPGLSQVMTYAERRDVSARIPWRGGPLWPLDPDPLYVEPDPEPPTPDPDRSGWVLVYVALAVVALCVLAVWWGLRMA